MTIKRSSGSEKKLEHLPNLSIETRWEWQGNPVPGDYTPTSEEYAAAMKMRAEWEAERAQSDKKTQ